MLAGAVQDTAADALPAVAVTAVGAFGTGVALGVTAAEGADAAEVPAGLVAVTVNVYAVPLVNPVTVEVVLRPFVLTPPHAAHAGVGMIV